MDKTLKNFIAKIKQYQKNGNIIEVGNTILSSDFITTSAGAGSSGKVPKLGADGKLDVSMFKTPAVVRTYTPTFSARFGADNTQWNISQPVAGTFRYTYTGTGTNPNINASTMPIGTKVYLYAQIYIEAGNQGFFTVTGVGNNYFEIANPSGVVETDTYLQVYSYVNTFTWTKPAGLRFIVVEEVGGGESGGDSGNSGKTAGGTSSFKSMSVTGGGASGAGLGGIATGGDINKDGENSWNFDGFLASDSRTGKSGKNSMMGKGAKGNIGYQESTLDGVDGGGGSGSYYNNSGQGGYGGASGAYAKKLYLASDLSATETVTVGLGGGRPIRYNIGGLGGNGKVIITEYY